MRLFFAIEADAVVQRHAEAIRERMTAASGAAARGLRWVSAKQLHLTLRFLGEVPSEADHARALRHAGHAAHHASAEQVIAACREAIAQSPFEIGFGAPSWLPDARRPRVLMLPVVAGLAPLGVLKRLVDARLPEGVPHEEPRPFTPHLTLARVRDEWRQDVRREAGELLAAGGRPPAVLAVSAVSLIESRLSSRGPDYHERARLSLSL